MFRGAHRRDFIREDGKDGDAAQDRRMEARLELRRNRRDDNLQKRRKAQNPQEQPNQSWEDMSAAQQQNLGTINEDLIKLKQILRSPEVELEKRENAVEEIRKLLSIEKQPPIQSVINAGMVEDLMNILRNKANSLRLRFEAAWALTNVASGSSSHTQVVVAAGGVEVFVDILATETGDIKEQAVWALGNIAGDSADLRDRVLRADALNYLLKIFITDHDNQGLLRNATWTLSNFCRGKPHADFEILKPSLNLLLNLLQVNDAEILVDACWAISYISDDPTPTNSRIQHVLQMGFVPKLLHLLEHPNSLVVHPALRAVGNIVTGNDEQTEEVLNQGALPRLKGLLQNEKVGIRKEACWTISNITAGNVSQIEKVIRENLIGAVLTHLESSVFEIRKEACWAISNATAGGNAEQIKYLVSKGAVKKLVTIVGFGNQKTIRVALEGLENILKSGEDAVDHGANPYVGYMQECRGFETCANALDEFQVVQVKDKINRILNFSKDFTAPQFNHAADPNGGLGFAI